MNRKNRSAGLYVLLVILLALSLDFQGNQALKGLRSLITPSQIALWPLIPQIGGPTIIRLSPEASKAGIHEDDELVAVDGRPYRGRGVLADALARKRVGDSVDLVVRHGEREAQRRLQEITVPIGGSRAGMEPDLHVWLLKVLLQILMPIFCLVVAFWVAGLRPRDPLAWLLLFLLLGFGQLPLSFDYTTWTGVHRDLMLGFHLLLKACLSIAMLLFGIYFPERLIYDRRWPWMKWMLLGPLVAFMISDLIIGLGDLEGYAVAGVLQPAIKGLGPLQQIFTMAGIGIFFFGLGVKLGTASSSDARRRLQLMLYGSQISLTPAFAASVYGIVRGTAPFEGLPALVTTPSLLLLFLFPVVLAYVIVVQRALELQVVIRQSVQYLLAKSGVRVLQMIVTFSVVIAAASLVINSSGNRPQKITIISAGIGLALVIGRLAERVKLWTDRRFFREAYDAELILSELSEKVRTMLETGPLLEMVARRIADSLHVQRVVMLTRQGGLLQPAFSLGFGTSPNIRFTEHDAAIEHVRAASGPVRVYADDPESWVNASADLKRQGELLKELDAQLLLPLAVREKLLGLISLGPKKSEAPYSSNDLRLLQSVAIQTGLALENSRLAASVAEQLAHRERMNREIEIAREVQEQLFPQRFPDVEGLDYSGACRPALGVGGDYYDFLPLPNGRLGVAIGDVSGKGIPAALLMASLQASLRAQTIGGSEDLAALMCNLNHLIYEASTANRYATFFYAEYRPSDRMLTYVNAGHNPPLVLRRDDAQWTVQHLDAGGTVVGLLPDFPYQQADIRLNAGDVLVGFTDGISEALNPAEEEWGEERLIDAVKSCEGLDARQTVANLMKAADAFINGAKQHDDMTLVVLRVAQNGEP